MDTLTGVPAETVGQVVQDFVNDGALQILVEREADGRYTVSAG